jgi:hypothetical protein
MNQLDTLLQHHALCDEIHAAVLAENRFLRQHQHAPDSAQTEHKRGLLAQLDQSLAALRILPAASARDPEAKAQLEKTRARILQILQLDKENEQLLLRCSLSGGKRVAGEVKPGGSVSMLQKIYARCS